jgi:PAS domain-containing protein
VYCNESFCKISGYNRAEVMQKSCRCAFMFGELTDKETISRVDHVLEHQLHDQFEILLYKKNSKCRAWFGRSRQSVLPLFMAGFELTKSDTKWYKCSDDTWPDRESLEFVCFSVGFVWFRINHP